MRKTYRIPTLRHIEPRRSTPRIMPNKNIRQPRPPTRIQHRVQKPKRAQTRINPRTIQQRNNSRKRRRTSRRSTNEDGLATNEDTEEVALGGDVGIGAAGSVEETSVGALRERREVRRDDGVLVGRTGEVVGETATGEEAGDGGFGDVVGGAYRGDAEKTND